MFFFISLQVLVTGVEAVEVLHQLLPLKIMACCYDNKNTNTAWPTIPVKNLKYRIKSRAVDRSAIQFLTILGVLLKSIRFVNNVWTTTLFS